MEYEALHPVHIAFILTDYADAPSGVRRGGLCYRDSGELYDDLMELVLVYVPTVAKGAAMSREDDLYVTSI
jgi:hypothetical protein